MKYGIQMFPTDYAIPVTELGRAAEELGFESVFFPEHTHIPTSRRTPWPGGGELPKEYSHTLDPFVVCAAVAAVTKTLKVGTGVCLVMQRDPIITAKEVASVDHFSGGRFLFGIGGGWNEDEMENHGTDPKLRWKILRERILAMKEIWTKEEAEFHGKFVNFDPIWQWPKPVQKPHPPILVGGAGPHTLDRVLEYGDGWMPIGGRTGQVLAGMIRELQERAKAAGRGPIPVSVFGVPPSKEVIEQYAEMGVDRVIFGVRPEGADQVLPALKRYAEVAGL
ncbi:LLM class F420-dependent oxidoreductase [Tepidiforma thermophila]|uniref:Putative F420-dependent oxidoreductase n=1 Tax=Tepidiforma thermophila (strain KCTC 52669 / CGMCC 1.13589 / G233) TaxID=2761530 RepID=A0A2A9HF08_TEPT2|nr:LLM class F420-dependent oxidoreductase [Tepidiforma thermophila]PFG73369.1 putative F420-dependent oxidoreductase [Tepidiforma thermophila]